MIGPFGQSEHSCMFEFVIGGEKFSLRVFKNAPSAANIAYHERLTAALLAKDPMRRYFMIGGRIIIAPRADFNGMFDFDRCDLNTGPNVYCIVTPQVRDYLGGGIAHLLEGLALLHGPIGEPIAHGNVRRANLRTYKGNPVFVDFSEAVFAEQFGAKSPDTDMQMFRVNIDLPVHVAPKRPRE